MSDIAFKHLQYQFNNIDLFWQALTHGSWVNENNCDGTVKNYQRLEFLGDSVLKLIQGTLLYEKYLNWSEGQLTQVRSAYENNKNISLWTQKLGVDKLIRCGKSIDRKSDSFGQICAEVFEAIIGAIWIDCNCNFSVMIDIYKKWDLQTEEEKIIENPKKELQEFLQSKKLALPNYKKIAKTGPDHMPIFTIECRLTDLNICTLGTGKSTKEAEKNAAKQMINKLTSTSSQ